jgi:hypothetical protein
MNFNDQSLCFDCFNNESFPKCKPEDVETDRSEGDAIIIRCKNYAYCINNNKQKRQ